MAVESTLPILKEASQVPGLLKEIYIDALKPGVSQVGKALETVLGLGNTILLPLYLLNERARLIVKKNLETYRETLKDFPEAEIVAVSPEVGVPIVEKLSYVSDDELSNLYITLLSKASTAPTAGLAHPSFVHIINSLCPDEAVLLKVIRARRVLPFVTTTLKKPDRTFHVVKDICTEVEDEIQFTFVDNFEAYLSNLTGHGIITIRRDVHVGDRAVYEKLEGSLRQQAEEREWYKTRPKDWTLDFLKGKIEITPFGHLFLEACLKKLQDT